MRAFPWAAVWLLCATTATAQTYDFSEVDAVVERFLDSSLTNGVGLIITTPQAVVYERVYGTAVERETVALLSATKMPSTTAILTLVSEGRLGLDDCVGDYLDDWPADKQAITIRQCLSCTAGFRFFHPPNRERTLAEDVAVLAEQRLLAPPGKLFSYSGAGFQVAGRVAEVVSGQPWDEFFRDRVAVPLRLRTFDCGPPPGLSLSSGATSDLQDYAAILRLHLNDGVADGQPVLAGDVVREMRADQIDDRRMLVRLYPFGFRYGLSWWITVSGSQTDPCLFSDQGATGATPWIDTQRRYGVFLYLKGLAPNYVAAARLWAEVARACNEQFDVSTSDRSLPAIRPASRR
ncbi:MAG: serine hydrolase domain-containing protein [Planctomycetaceae bacterium]|nr:serine hydrolase domain-containing protein [Planctomycetaceae bacterium]